MDESHSGLFRPYRTWGWQAGLRTQTQTQRVFEKCRVLDLSKDELCYDVLRYAVLGAIVTVKQMRKVVKSNRERGGQERKRDVSAPRRKQCSGPSRDVTGSTGSIGICSGAVI